MKLNFFSNGSSAAELLAAKGRTVPASTPPVPAPMLTTTAPALMAPITSLKKKAEQVVEAIFDELPGLVAVAVVDVKSGMTLASLSNSDSFKPEVAAAYNTEVVKQKIKAISALKLGDETIEDILITLTSQFHLIKTVNNGTRFLYLAINKRETNLAIAREVLRAHAQLLVE